MLKKFIFYFWFLFSSLYSFSQEIVFPDIFVAKKVRNVCKAESFFCYYYTSEGKLYLAKKNNFLCYTNKDTTDWVYDEIYYYFENTNNMITSAKKYRKNKLIPDSLYIGEIKYSYDTKSRIVEIDDPQENDNDYKKLFYYSDKLDSTFEYNLNKDSINNIKKCIYHYNILKKSKKKCIYNNDSLIVNYNYKYNYVLRNIVEKSDGEYRIKNFIYNRNYKLKGISEYWIDGVLHKNIYKFKYQKGLLVSKKLKGYWFINGKWRYCIYAYTANSYEFYK